MENPKMVILAWWVIFAVICVASIAGAVWIDPWLLAAPILLLAMVLAVGLLQAVVFDTLGGIAIALGRAVACLRPRRRTRDNPQRTGQLSGMGVPPVNCRRPFLPKPRI